MWPLSVAGGTVAILEQICLGKTEMEWKKKKKKFAGFVVVFADLFGGRICVRGRHLWKFGL